MPSDDCGKPQNDVVVGLIIERVAGVRWVSSERNESGWWWVKFQLDLNSKTAWHVVQAFSYVFNNLALNDPLPTTFFPVSSPPDMNGGPNEHLFWVIEAQHNDVNPSDVASALYQTLSFDIEDEEEWINWSNSSDEV